MKLLFDQNLSPDLVRRLADIYAGSIHVREIGLRDVDDSAKWGLLKLACTMNAITFFPLISRTLVVYLIGG